MIIYRLESGADSPIELLLRFTADFPSDTGRHKI